MAAFCTAPSLQGPIAQNLVDFVDCQSKALGEIGFRTLAAPDSSVGLMLTGLLTIFIALLGFRLLLGEAPRTRGIVLDVVRVGIVLTLATSWAAYHVLIYDIATQTPVALAAEIGQPAGLPGADGSVLLRVQDAADQLARLGGGPGASSTFLVSSLGALIATRIVTGLLLALGPLVATFLLFDATRGLFEGWVRALLAMVVGTFTTIILIEVELSVLEPVLDEFARAGSAGVTLPYGAQWPSAIAALFAVVILAGLIAALKIGSGFRFPSTQALSAVRPQPPQLAPRILASSADGPAVVHQFEDRSRAVVVGDSLSASIRRELRGSGPNVPGATPHAIAFDDRVRPAIGQYRLGQNHRRMTSQRFSSAARRRDRS